MSLARLVGSARPALLGRSPHLGAARGQAVRRALGAYNAAATVIEAYARRRAAVALLHLARHAATRLQSAWRRSSAVANLSRTKARIAKHAAAATLVQKLGRAYVARRFLRMTKAGAVRLQAALDRLRLPGAGQPHVVVQLTRDVSRPT